MHNQAETRWISGLCHIPPIQGASPSEPMRGPVRRPAAVRTEQQTHTGRTAVADRSAPRPKRRPNADSVRTYQEKTAGAVRHALPFARSGRIAAPQTGRSARRGTAENQPLPRRVHTRQGRSGTGSSPPRECGPQSGEGGERNGRRSFGSLRYGSARTRHARRPFGIRRPVGGKPCNGAFDPTHSDIGTLPNFGEPLSIVEQPRRDRRLGKTGGLRVGFYEAHKGADREHAPSYAVHVPRCQRSMYRYTDFPSTVKIPQ